MPGSGRWCQPLTPNQAGPHWHFQASAQLPDKGQETGALGPRFTDKDTEARRDHIHAHRQLVASPTPQLLTVLLIYLLVTVTLSWANTQKSAQLTLLGSGLAALGGKEWRRHR